MAGEPLLKRCNLDASAPARLDLASGAVDSRVLALLSQLTSDRKISVSTIKTGHPMGPVSPAGRENDHFYYRAFDITAIDGVPIADDPTAPGTIAVGNHLLGLSGEFRPTRVMGPSEWLHALGPGDRTGFRDDDHATSIHRDHLHIGF